MFLKPFATVYDCAVRARQWSYQRGFKRIHSLSVPVISVGNLTAGGVGKTPLVETIARFYLQRGVKAGILSRGYGRKGSEQTVLVSDGNGPVTSVEVSGDEPWMLSMEVPEATIVVGAERIRTGKEAIEKHGAQILVLDDGYQHLRLARDLNICLLDALNPLGNGLVLPAGPLRESPSALQRADLFVFTNALNCSMQEALERLGPHRRICENKPVVGTTLRPSHLRKVGPEWDEADCIPTENERVIAVSGIGNPNAFSRTLDNMGLKVARHLAYPDHHFFTEKDWQAIQRQVEQLDVRFLITTMKDAVRLAPVLNAMTLEHFTPQVLALRVNLEITWNEEFFRQWLENVLP